jgi:hypothetical protein
MIVKNPSQKRDLDQIIESLGNELADSKLAEAEALMNEGMQACRELVGS